MKTPSPKVAEAQRLRRAGLSLREVAKQVGASHVTVRKWCEVAETDDEAPTSPTAATAPLSPPEIPTFEAVPLADSLEFVRTAMRQSFEIAHKAKDVGNYSASQRASRDVAMFAAVAARLEKQHASEGDTMRLSRADIDAATASAMTKLKALNDRGGLRCCDCDRALSISFGGMTVAEIDQRMKNGS